ncbi:hypothetical protein ACM40_08435 [Chryseobacterium sp. BLS98]|jgi:O-antigen/teichoic acid export membrane protein|uniref:flippase n=1 Tax=Chryseobacterium sp. BLS98 TaxID=885586 RepID=UPI00065AF5FA|nr:flippase [Chryseobacterium sp. BLS98]KMQ62316.1 hypothetical protein ACM40_08435 [Chryseobacterium sp. BLS98]
MAVFKNYIFNFLLLTSQLLFPLIVMPYTNRILGPKTVGIFNLVDNFAQYFITIAALGISVYGVREISKAKFVSKQNLNETFSELISINSILTVFVLIVYFFFVFLNPTVKANQTYYLIGSIQVLVGVFSLEWFFQGTENFKFIAVRTLIVKIISIVAVFLFVKNASDGLIYYFITVLTFVLTSILNIIFINKTIEYRLPSIKNLKKHLSPLLTFFTTKFMISIYVTMTTILLGFLSTEQGVGYFSLAFRVFNIVVILVSSLTTVVLSKTAIMVTEDRKAFQDLISKIVIFNIFMGLPAAILVNLYAKEFIYVLGGKSFEPAVFSLKFFSVLIFVIPFSNLFALNILTPLRKENDFLKATIIGTIISLILNFSLIPSKGYLGATYAFLTTEIIVSLSLFYFAYRRQKFNLHLSFLFKTLVASSFFIPIYYFLPDINTLQRLLLGMFISGVFYLLFQIFIIKDSIIIYYIKPFLKIKLNQNEKK